MGQDSIKPPLQNCTSFYDFPKTDLNEDGMEAIDSNDKRVIDGHSDVNQLMPFKYNWAWRDFLDAQKNHWTPLDISMSEDIADYPNLTEDEKHIYDGRLKRA